MNWKDYILMALPVPVYYLYKGKDGKEKVTSRRRAFYPVNQFPHPIADELHGVYLKLDDIPEMDEVFDTNPSDNLKQADSNSEYRCPYIDR